MKVLNLSCAHGHGFEGWFGSNADYLHQLEAGLVACPLCGNTAIAKLPSAPRIHMTRERKDGDKKPSSSPSSSSSAVTPTVAPEAQWLKAVQHVMANTDDVGDRFAEEARRIHYGESDKRGIRGQTTPNEVEALREEGIEVLALPVPEALKGPIQ